MCIRAEVRVPGAPRGSVENLAPTNRHCDRYEPQNAATVLWLCGPRQNGETRTEKAIRPTDLEGHVQHFRVGHAHQGALSRAEIGPVHPPPAAAAVVDVEVARAVRACVRMCMCVPKAVDGPGRAGPRAAARSRGEIKKHESAEEGTDTAIRSNSSDSGSSGSGTALAHDAAAAALVSAAAAAAAGSHTTRNAPSQVPLSTSPPPPPLPPPLHPWFLTSAASPTQTRREARRPPGSTAGGRPTPESWRPRNRRPNLDKKKYKKKRQRGWGN